MLGNITCTLLLAAIAAVSSTGSSEYPAQNAAGGTPSTPLAKTTLTSPIYVAGYSVRTTNAAEAGGQGEIPKLWGSFFQENLGASIPHRIGEQLMVVYSDYASDEKGEYTYLLGVPVDSIEGLPKDATYRKIPAGAYAVVTSPTGPFQEVVPAVWKQIWATPATELGGKRSFVADYEIYHPLDGNPSQGQVEVHLGLVAATSSK